MQLLIARNRRAQKVQDLSSRSGVLCILRDVCCESDGPQVQDQFTAQTVSPFTVLADSVRHHTAHQTRAAIVSAQIAASNPAPGEHVRSKHCSRKTDCTGIRASCYQQTSRSPTKGGRPWTCLLGLFSTSCHFPKTGRKTSHSAYGGATTVSAVPIVCTHAAPVSSFLCQQPSVHPFDSDKRWRKLCQCLDSCLSLGH